MKQSTQIWTIWKGYNQTKVIEMKEPIKTYGL